MAASSELMSGRSVGNIDTKAAKNAFCLREFRTNRAIGHLLQSNMDKSSFSIGGIEYPRVKYGDEEDNWGATSQACSSCGVSAGQFHHVGCFVERCPKCKGQVMSCRCEYDESFTRHPMSNGRRAFYKFFYLAILPLCITAIVVSFLPFNPGIRLVIMLGIPLLITAFFWNKMGEMELNQVIVTPKG